MKKNVFYLLTCLSLILSCSDSEDDIEQVQNDSPWSIPANEVRDGGPGKDGIPSIDNPNFTNAKTVDFLNDDDLVIGILKNNEAKAYPHIIMDWHEISNDAIGDDFFTLNYCPLTGTAFAWESMTNGSPSTFGVSGLLYNANLILYDRNTDSNWSQLQLECVNGELIGDKPEVLNVVETNWETWKALYPNSEVLNTQTGFSRTYGTSPYGDYSTNNDRFIFVPSILNDALPNKDRVYCIIDGDKSKVYQFSDFTNGNVIKDSFNGKNYLIVGNENIINAFELTEANQSINFEYEWNVTNGSIFKDDSGNTWSIFGNVVSGSQDNALQSPKSVMSYWFAIAAFYPNPEIYSIP